MNIKTKIIEEIDTVINYLNGISFPKSYSEYVRRVRNENNILCLFYHRVSDNTFLTRLSPSAYILTLKFKVRIIYIRDLLMDAFEIFYLTRFEKEFIDPYEKTKAEVVDLLKQFKEACEYEMI